MALFRFTSVAVGALLLSSLSPAAAQPLTKDQRKCSVAMNKSVVKVASALGKNVCACIQDGSDGKLPGTIEACLATDEGGKVGGAVAKMEEKFDKLCTGTSKNDPASPKLPPFGVTDPATATAAVTEKETDLAHDVFGPDLDAAVVLAATDRRAAKCQQAVIKKVKKCEQAMLKSFVACKKAGFKDEAAPFDEAADLEACIGADPEGKVAKKCDLSGEKVDGIRKALDKKCASKGVSLASALPGCGLADAEQTHACLHDAVQCRVCLALDQADGLARNCDLFDDGSANGSCPSPLGRRRCGLNPETSGFTFDTGIFADIFSISGAIDVDCGAIDPATGKASCTCEVAQIDPVPILPDVAVACVNPAAGCPAGEIACNGGDLYNSAITSMHGIGACTSNADCATQCAATCGGAGAVVFDSGCEGFCRGGSADDTVCMTDAGCPGGTCNGLDATVHGNICQCECLDTSGDPSLPGGLRCNLGVDIDVELAEPCGDGDVLFRIGERCVPFTTETTQGVILDANTIPGLQIPPGTTISSGLPLTCTELGSSAVGLGLVSSVNVFDVELAGDIAFFFSFDCQ